jgi:hypothetical protein
MLLQIYRRATHYSNRLTGGVLSSFHTDFTKLFIHPYVLEDIRIAGNAPHSSGLFTDWPSNVNAEMAE